jgi:rRNA-processing protein FCF1
MKIIINDTNILIDLVRLDLMNEFIQLGLELKTTDFVFDELNENQKKYIEVFVHSGQIELIKTESAEDYDAILAILRNCSGLSFEDCSVWYYAVKMNGILLSGDGRLRKMAVANGINVKGILYVFDQLLLHQVISFECAIEKLNFLHSINSRLPIIAINERLFHWALENHI